MVKTEPVADLPIGATLHAALPVAVDEDFETRWAAWVARGRVHEQRARRRVAISATVLAAGAALLYTFLRS